MSRKTTVLINVLIALMVAAAWCMMLFRTDGNGALSVRGFGSLRYFTVLSNLAEGAAAGCCAVAVGSRLRTGREGVPAWTVTFRFIAAASTALTFLTVTFFLGPLYGFATMYAGANFFFHLIVPLTAAAAFCLDGQGEDVPFRATLPAVLPMAAYGAFYLGNNLIRGIGPDTDWYGFLNWGWPTGLIIFAVLMMMTWGAAVCLRALRIHARRRLARRASAERNGQNF